MTKFFYSARDQKGLIQTGIIEAQDSMQAKNFLESKGLMTLWLNEKEESQGFTIMGRITTSDKAIFMRQLATMLDAGFPVDKSLKIIETETRSKRFQEVIASVIDQVEAGESLWRAMSSQSQVFDPVTVAVVRSGESAGRLPNVLAVMAKTLEEEASFQASLWAALAYPVFVVAAMLVVGTVVLTSFVPKIGSLFTEANTQLPWQTRALVAVGSFLTTYWWGILAALVIFGGYLYWYVTSSRAGRLWFENLLLSLPIVKELLMRSQLSRMNRLFFLLLSSATPILEAIDLVAESMSLWIFQNALKATKEQVSRGLPFSTSLAKEAVFPMLEAQLVSVGEQTGSLEPMFDRLAKYYQERTNEYVKKVISLIEPVVIVILAFGVAIMVWSVFGPIYGLVQMPVV